jgi:hypothetical protein
MVRLDDATNTYATALGKSASELTNFEKRQAFMNAVLDEGETKFKAMGNVPTNSYDQLAASFADLTKTLLGLLNNGLLPIVNFFAGSQIALFGGLVLFAKGIASSMIPALADLGGGYAESRKAAAKLSLEQVKLIKNIEGGGKGLKKAAAAFDPSIHGQKELNKMQRLANQSVVKNTGDLKLLRDARDKDTASIQRKKIMLEGSLKAQKAASTAILDYSDVQREEGDAAAVNAAAQGNFSESMTLLGGQYDEINKSTKRAEKGTKGWTKTTIKARGVAAKTAISVRVLGTAFLAAIPFIGQIVFALGVLVSIGSKVISFFTSDAHKKYTEEVLKQKEANQELLSSLEAVMQFNAGLGEAVGTVTQKYIALNNVFNSMEAQMKRLEAVGGEGGGFLRFMQILAGDFGGLGGYQNMTKTLVEGNQLTQESFSKVADGFTEAEQKNIRYMIESQNFTKLTDAQHQVLLQKLIPSLNNVPTAMRKMTEATKGANEAIDNFMNDIAPRTSVDGILASFADMEKGMSDFGQSTGKEWLKGFKENAGENLLKLIGFEDILKDIPGSDDSEARAKIIRRIVQQRISGEKERLKISQTTERNAKIRITTLKSEQDLLKKNTLSETDAMMVVQKAKDIRAENRKILQAQLDDYIRTNKVSKEDEDTHERIVLLRRQIADIDSQTEISAEEQVEAAKALLRIAEHTTAARSQSLQVMQQMQQMSQKIVDSELQIAEMRIAEANREDPSRGYKAELNANDKLLALRGKMNKDTLQVDENGEFRLAREESVLAAKKQAVMNEYNMTILKNKIERTLLQARLRVVDKELQLAHENAGGTGDYAGRGEMTRMLDQLGEGGVFANLQKAMAESMKDAGLAGIDAMENALKDQRKTQVIGAEGSTTSERLKNADTAGGFESLDHLSEKFQALQNIMGPTLESLRSLGPDGELAATVAGGALVIGEAWSRAGEEMGKTAEGAEGRLERATIGLEAIGATVAQIGQMMQAASSARIAAVDREIAAEKRRDGKSKESVGKIKALEKKKEAMQKKAFEQNKKLQMAQVIINTASGMMRAYSDFDGFTATALMVMIAALGAAQLAIISGTSFQGSGSSPSAAAPSKITAGKRRDTVDLARSQSARGELSYFRGEQGAGSGPEAFRPAFYGKKNRAMGGATGYVVGEQGPELFVPNRPGTIVPADETAEMGAGANVTFNINTIDATGVEDLLIAQRGNVIGMIREASNSYGQTFLEDVDTDVYTPQTGGVSRY